MPRRKRASATNQSSNEANEAAAPPPRKIPPEHSQILCKAYNDHEGDYYKIMKDSRVVELNYPEKKIRDHIHYVRTKKNKAKGGERGTTHRRNIINEIATTIEGQEDGLDKVEETPLDLSTPEASPPRSPLSPREQSIDEVDSREAATAVSSTQVPSAESFKQFANKEKTLRSLRSTKVAENKEQKRTTNLLLKQQMEDNDTAQQMKNVQGLVMVSLMKQAVQSLNSPSSSTSDSAGTKFKKKIKLLEEKQSEVQFEVGSLRMEMGCELRNIKDDIRNLKDDILDALRSNDKDKTGGGQQVKEGGAEAGGQTS
jgi:hypothetical protein